jgi:hypothetical protein
VTTSTGSKATPNRTATRKPRTSEREMQMAVQDQDARVPEDDRAVETNDGTKAPLCDKLFKIDTEQGLMPLMEWAAANDTTDPQNGPQLAALFFMLKDIVVPDEWDEFRAHAKLHKAKGPDFLKFQEAAAEVIAAVPTEQPETS